MADGVQEAVRNLVSRLICVRRGTHSPSTLQEPLGELLNLMTPTEVQRALLQPLEARVTSPPLPEPTYARLLQALSRYLSRPSAEHLVELARVLRSSLQRPCSPDARLEAERSRLEERMSRVGLLLGVVFPLVFVAGFLFYRSVLAALATAVAIIVVWSIVRHQGTRFAQANIEQAWAACEYREPWRDEHEGGALVQH